MEQSQINKNRERYREVETTHSTLLISGIAVFFILLLLFVSIMHSDVSASSGGIGIRFIIMTAGAIAVTVLLYQGMKTRPMAMNTYDPSVLRMRSMFLSTKLYELGMKIQKCTTGHQCEDDWKEYEKADSEIKSQMKAARLDQVLVPSFLPFLDDVSNIARVKSLIVFFLETKDEDIRLIALGMLLCIAEYTGNLNFFADLPNESVKKRTDKSIGLFPIEKRTLGQSQNQFKFAGFIRNKEVEEIKVNSILDLVNKHSLNRFRVMQHVLYTCFKYAPAPSAIGHAGQLFGQDKYPFTPQNYATLQDTQKLAIQQMQQQISHRPASYSSAQTQSGRDSSYGFGSIAT